MSSPSLPQIPRPPVSPPRRTSSLAFNTHQRCNNNAPGPASANIGRKRTMSPIEPAQMDTMLETANATLCRDALAAASSNSIAARMYIDTNASRIEHDTALSTPWRYSTAPARLATTSVDVREPFPPLKSPKLVLCTPLNDSTGIEAVSSGFYSYHSSPSQENALNGPFESLKIESDASSHGSFRGRQIYLSPNAEAAAHSAKAKRRVLHGIACPDPDVHIQGSVGPLTEQKQTDSSPPEEIIDSQVSKFRATETGSPMPFTRNRPRPLAANSAGGNHPMSAITGPTASPRGDVIGEHFRPGWYYAQEPLRPAARPTYSFSTAASKVEGMSQAPDSRIRDSYKTDTLTALAKRPSRYRKNGIGAELASRGVSRYYQKPTLSYRPRSARSRPSSRQTYAGQTDIRFRSSPPPAPGPERAVLSQGIRAMDDFVVVMEDVTTLDPGDPRTGRPKCGNQLLAIDDRTKAAVRLSVFGTSTPEGLRHARESMKELSPNVQSHQGSAEDHYHTRKKRRPGCWDNDVKKVRASPAGRGGVSSPVSAKVSMQADFEIASSGTGEMNLDRDDLADTVMQQDEDLGVKLSSTAEHEVDESGKVSR